MASGSPSPERHGLRDALMQIRLHGSVFWDDDWPSPAKIASAALDADDREVSGGATEAQIEAVARAYFNRHARGDSWSKQPDIQKNIHREFARAALASGDREGERE